MPTATKKLDLWFDWEGDPDGARVHFALLTEQDYVAIRETSQQGRQYLDRESNGVQIEIKTDSKAARRETAIRATKGWEQFFDANRAVMECTPENIEFWSCSADFMTFLIECQVKLRELADADLEKARKNS